MTGLTMAARRPWLLLVPLALDLLLWLAPRLSIAGLVQRFWRGWETLVRATYAPGQLDVMADMLKTLQEGMTMLGAQVNLLDVLAGSWLGPPSAIAVAQTTRLNFISELVLAPVGLVPAPARLAAAPWQSVAIEVRSLPVALFLVVAFWLIAQVVAALWLRWLAAGLPRPRPLPGAGEAAGADAANGVAQVAQLIGFCLFLGVILFVLRLPLGAAIALLLLSNSALAGLIFALVEGATLWITLWLLLSLYFTSEGLLFERQPVWRSMLQGAAMLRGNVTATLGLVGLINLLLVGFRAVWGIIGQTPAGGLLAIVGNAYLATAMVLAVFVHYGALREQWAVALEKQQAQKSQAEK